MTGAQAPTLGCQPQVVRGEGLSRGQRRGPGAHRAVRATRLLPGRGLGDRAVGRRQNPPTCLRKGSCTIASFLLSLPALVGHQHQLLRGSNNRGAPEGGRQPGREVGTGPGSLESTTGQGHQPRPSPSVPSPSPSPPPSPSTAQPPPRRRPPHQPTSLSWMPGGEKCQLGVKAWCPEAQGVAGSDCRKPENC